MMASCDSEIALRKTCVKFRSRRPLECARMKRARFSLISPLSFRMRRYGKIEAARRSRCWKPSSVISSIRLTIPLAEEMAVSITRKKALVQSDPSLRAKASQYNHLVITSKQRRRLAFIQPLETYITIDTSLTAFAAVGFDSIALQRLRASLGVPASTMLYKTGMAVAFKRLEVRASATRFQVYKYL